MKAEASSLSANYNMEETAKRKIMKAEASSLSSLSLMDQMKILKEQYTNTTASKKIALDREIANFKKSTTKRITILLS